MTAKIGTIQIKCGESKNSWLPLGHAKLKLPVTVTCGMQAGPTVLISAGIHGAEYVGIQTVMELSRELKPVDVKGSLIFLLTANPTAVKEYARFVVPEDGKNLNQVFPGARDGSVSEQIAYAITHEFQSQADYYIDVHAGDASEAVMPFVYFTRAAKPEVCRMSEEMAKAADVAIRASSSAETGAYSSACLRGVPSILMERGGGGCYTKEEVALYKQDIRNVLIHLGSIEGKEVHTVRQERVDQASYIAAAHDGFWYPQLHAGDPFLKGASLGEVRDVWGELLCEYRAEHDGIILYQTVALGIQFGDPLIAYGKICKNS